MEEKQNTSKTQIYNLVILDRSGSMRSIANAAISGFNETVGGIRSAQERYKDTQEHFVSLFTFCDCAKNYVYENIPVAEIKELTSSEYRPCCCTPLYDAMGISLNKLLSQIKDKDDATAVVTVITDGLENASKEFSGKDIKALVDKLKDEEGWNFAYIGTNQDVEAVSSSLSIDNHMTFIDDEEGMTMAWAKERKAKTIMYARLEEERAETEGLSAIARKLFHSKSNKANRHYREVEEFSNRFAPNHIGKLKNNEIFVFGSNAQGLHGGGAAATAMKYYGAVWGQGEGLQGQSYAIPTMGTLDETEQAVQRFIKFAKEHPELRLLVTKIGCGIAGYTPRQIAPMFAGVVNVENVCLPEDFWKEIV